MNGSHFNYTYNIHLDNKNALSLHALAVNASKEFVGLSNFDLFHKYYGEEDYADRWVTAAAEPAATGFETGYVANPLLPLFISALYLTL